MEQLLGLVSANYNTGNFGKLTVHRPIAAIPFGSRYRLIDFPLSNMVNSGITSVGLITPHYYRSIMDHLGSGKEFGLSRKRGGLFVLPGSTYGYDLGEGKYSLRDFRGNMEFFERELFDRLILSSCNKIYNIDYKHMVNAHKENDANISLAYKKVESASAGEYILEIDDKKRVKSFRKLKKDAKDVLLFIDSMVLDRKVIMSLMNWYRDNTYLDLCDIIGENLSHISVAGYEFDGYVKAVNNVEDYMDASRELLNDDIIKELFMTERRYIHTKVHDAAPVKYSETAKVSKSIVGTGTIIKGEIENSIIFRDSMIDEGAVIKNSVIMQKCHICKDAVLENVICEKGVEIGEGEIHKAQEKKTIVISND